MPKIAATRRQLHHVTGHDLVVYRIADEDREQTSAPAALKQFAILASKGFVRAA